MIKKKTIIWVIIIVIIILIGILVSRIIWPGCLDCKNRVIPLAGQTGLPNPASVNCEELGGMLSIKKDASGGEVGFCTLPDGSICEEWSLLRYECSENSDHFLHLNIRPGDKIESPLKITGESSGGWFFEGSFPINIVDWDGRIIAEGLAKAKGDWMTTNFVPFEANLTFTKPANPTNQDYASKGVIIFKKDNPSGLPKNDATYELPIRF